MSTPQEILRQIFASEPDYVEIRERRDALLLVARTPAQDAELSQYAGKLAHDVSVIGQWFAQLPLIVRQAINGPASRLLRAQVLDELDTRETERRDEWLQRWMELDTEEQDTTARQRLRDELQQRIDIVTARRARIAAVRTAANTWGF
jgi:hypothetical protein